jgi:integrase
METSGRPDGGVCAAVDVHYLPAGGRPGGSRAGRRCRLRARAGRTHRAGPPGSALPAGRVLPAPSPVGCWSWRLLWMSSQRCSIAMVRGRRRGDVDLWQREITVRGKGRKTRTVKISFDAARSLDRYLRVRARHAQAWSAAAVARGRQPGADDGQRDLPGHRAGGPPVRHRGVPAPFRHHFSHTWLDRGGAEGDLMELKAGPPRRCSAATAPAPAAPGHAAATPRHGGHALT